MRQNYNPKNEASILEHAKKMCGRSLRPFLDKKLINRIEKGDYSANKGFLGQFLEKYFFRIAPNNKSAPDFPEAGVELKTAGVIKKGKRLVPKEPRLILSVIDYKNIINEVWDESSLLKKSKLLLLMFYLYEQKALPIDYIFKLVDLWRFPERDLQIIRQDWESIVSKIRDGNAEELSEGDTYYLGATTKGETAERSKRKQAGTKRKAKQRAFSLKKTYLETIIATLLLGSNELQPVITSPEEIENKKFEDVIINKFTPYFGKTVEAIAQQLDVDWSARRKDRYAILARAMMGITKRNVEEFVKADIQMKTIRLERNGRPKEDMSFPYFKYLDIIEEEWDTSTLKTQFSKKFFFVIYQKDSHGRLIFRYVKFWNMPYSILEGDVRRVWEKTVFSIKKGHAEDLPKKSESDICHIRPHGKDSQDTIPAPRGKMLTKKCFWLNNSYIAELLKE